MASSASMADLPDDYLDNLAAVLEMEKRRRAGSIAYRPAPASMPSWNPIVCAPYDAEADARRPGPASDPSPSEVGMPKQGAWAAEGLTLTAGDGASRELASSRTLTTSLLAPLSAYLQRTASAPHQPSPVVAIDGLDSRPGYHDRLSAAPDAAFFPARFAPSLDSPWLVRPEGRPPLPRLHTRAHSHEAPHHPSPHLLTPGNYLPVPAPSSSGASMCELTSATTAPTMSRPGSFTGSMFRCDPTEMARMSSAASFFGSGSASATDDYFPTAAVAWSAAHAFDGATSADERSSSISHVIAHAGGGVVGHATHHDAAAAAAAATYTAETPRRIAPKVAADGGSTAAEMMLDLPLRSDGAPAAAGERAEAVRAPARPRRERSKTPLVCEREACKSSGARFRGEHELARHVQLKHHPVQTMWQIVDISPTGDFLANCPKCARKTRYNQDYNAAAHLRRKHFNPRERAALDEPHQTRCGSSGGTWPPMSDLRRWMKMILVPRRPGAVVVDEAEAAAAAEDEVDDGLVDLAPSLPSAHALVPLPVAVPVSVDAGPRETDVAAPAITAEVDADLGLAGDDTVMADGHDYRSRGSSRYDDLFPPDLDLGRAPDPLGKDLCASAPFHPRDMYVDVDADVDEPPLAFEHAFYASFPDLSPLFPDQV
ncbi:MAG: hypothetical protein M1826_006312 [Phylliscum demangeonii]|nr:MAG: hypothetical protein M1826_006312 [Phylliscum demangeonii]